MPSSCSVGPRPLLEALEKLCAQVLPAPPLQLLARDLPEVVTFYADTRGGAFLLIDKETPQPSSDPSPAILLENYPDVLWTCLGEALQPYHSSDVRLATFYWLYPDIPGVDLARRFVCDVPSRDTAFFLHTLVERGWSLPLSEFSYQLHWSAPKLSV